MFVNWLINKWYDLFKFPSYTTTLPLEKISTLVIADSSVHISDINAYNIGNAYNLLLVKLPDMTLSTENSIINNTVDNNITIYNHYNINKKYRHLVLLLDTFSLKVDLDAMLKIIFSRLPKVQSLSLTLLSSKYELELLEKKVILLKFSPVLCGLLGIDILNYIIALCIVVVEDGELCLLRLIKLREKEFKVVFVNKSH